MAMMEIQTHSSIHQSPKKDRGGELIWSQIIVLLQWILSIDHNMQFTVGLHTYIFKFIFTVPRKFIVWEYKRSW